MKLDYSKISNVQIEDIDHTDYPDFCDAYIISADYNGVPMTEDQLEEINNDSQYVHEQVLNWLY